MSEAAVAYHLVRGGYNVARPLGDNARYDLIVEDRDFRLLRVQVKTGRIVNGAITFATSSSQAHRGRGRRSYLGQCDVFAVYCPALEETFLVPVADVGAHGCVLRLDPTGNGQHRGVRWAADYRLASVDLRTLVPLAIGDRACGVRSDVRNTPATNPA